MNCIKCKQYPIPHGATKFCGKACESQFKYEKYIADWKAGRISGIRGFGVSPAIRRYLLSKRGEQCWNCNWHERNPVTNRVPVQIDHIDGNWKNTKEENLRLICPNCHSLTKTYGNLNKGYGRAQRKNVKDYI